MLAVYQHYQSIPEARDLRWNDNFFDVTNNRNEFDTEQDNVAVFDFNYEQIADYDIKTCGRLSYLLALSFTLLFWGLFVWLFNVMQTGFYGEYDEYGEYYEGKSRDFTVPIYAYCILFPVCMLFAFIIIYHIKWSTYSKHIAISRDGIRYVSDKHKSCCGISMCDIGKSSKTIPFDKITDCDIVEPAGAVCCCIQRVLTSVRIHSASSGGDGGSRRHELDIVDLVNPHGFKKLVWAMKRLNYSNNQYTDPNLLFLSSNGYHNTTITSFR